MRLIDGMLLEQVMYIPRHQIDWLTRAWMMMIRSLTSRYHKQVVARSMYGKKLNMVG
jgi:hypothetical protein